MGQNRSGAQANAASTNRLEEGSNLMNRGVYFVQHDKAKDKEGDGWRVDWQLNPGPETG